MSELEASIESARRDKRWVDASVDLERWLALSKGAYLAEVAELPTSVAPSGGLVGKLFASKPRRSFTSDEEELSKLLPRVQKGIEKFNSSKSERVAYLSFVNKHNAHGKVQARLLVVTDSALYNFDHGGSKPKRRIALAAIGSVSANEASGQFVLHVPSEYDYHFSVPSHGHSVGSEEAAYPSTPLAGMISALHQSYAGVNGGSADSPNLLAVRNITSETDLSRHVQKKGQGSEEASPGMRFTTRAGDESDD